MIITLFRNIGGYCDYLDNDHEIEVRVQKKQCVGQPNPVYIPSAYECSYANECKRDSACPLWKAACKMNN